MKELVHRHFQGTRHLTMRCPRGYFFAAEIEIPEKVEVFRSDDTQTEFAYPIHVQAKHPALFPGRLVGGRWVFGPNGRGYYVKDETLSAFKIEPRITPHLQVSGNPSEEPLKFAFSFLAAS